MPCYRRLSTAFVCTLVFVLLLSGCGAATSAPADASPDASVDAPTDAVADAVASSAPAAAGEVRTIEHSMDTTDVTCTPERVVTLGQGATDAALALGVTPVGAADPWGGQWYAYLADQVEGITSIGSETEPNLEAIAALQPDLIIGSQTRHEAIYDQLTQIAPTVFAEGIGKVWKENFQLYAQALCREETGDELLAAWEARIADFQAQMGDRLNTEVSLVRFRSGEVRIYTTGFPGSILREAGLQRPESQEVADWDNDPQVMNLSKEQIPLMDGDVMFYMVSDWGNNEGSAIQAEWIDHPLWQTLTVVQNDAVYPVNEEHWNLGGGIQAANRLLDDLYAFFLPDATPAPAAAEAAGDDAAAFPVTIEHKYGSTTIEAQPQRIVTVGLIDHDALLALGIVPVGTTEWFGEYPGALWPWAQEKLAELGGAVPTVVGGSDGINFEQIAALNPDLILALYSGVTEEEYGLLREIAPTVAQPAEYVDYGIPWQDLTRKVGQAVGKAAEADALIADVEARFAQVRAEHPEFEGATSVVATPYQGIWVYGPQDVRGRFLTMLGFQLPDGLAEITGAEFGGNLSMERADLLDVDVIIWLDADDAEGELGGPVYSSLPVHTEGREVFLDSYNDPLGGATSFVSVLSLPFLLDGLVPQLADALDGASQ